MLDKWEPKIHKMLNRAHLSGIEYDDAIQELRLTVINSARVYRKAKGASFHTYLHAAIRNTINGFVHQAQKKLGVDEIQDNSASKENDPEPFFSFIYGAMKLSIGQKILCDLLLCGYKKKEIIGFSVDPKKTKELLIDLEAKALIYQQKESF